MGSALCTTAQASPGCLAEAPVLLRRLARGLAAEKVGEGLEETAKGQQAWLEPSHGQRWKSPRLMQDEAGPSPTQSAHRQSFLAALGSAPPSTVGEKRPTSTVNIKR